MGAVLIALGVLSLAYGASIMLLWSGSAFFCVWYVLGAALAAVGAAMRTGAWARLPLPVRLCAGATGAVALLAVAALSACIVGAAGARTEGHNLDYLIVLGAQVRKDRSPSPSLRYRLETARDYLQEHPHTRCVVSGGQGQNEPCAEADAMAAWLEGQGIDGGRILRERRSVNTVQNIRFSARAIERTDGARIAGVRVGIVTNDFHEFRSVAIARKQGLPLAVPVPARSVAYYLPNNVLRECFGVVKDLLAGNM